MLLYAEDRGADDLQVLRKLSIRRLAADPVVLLGGAVAEVTAEEAPVRMRLLGFPGFCPTGSATFLLDHFGMTPDGIAAAAREVIGG